MPLSCFAKPWVQLPLFRYPARVDDVQRGVVVQMSSDAKEAQAIIRLVMSLKPPPPLTPDSAANSPEITPTPDPELFVRRGVELQVFDAKKKLKRKGPTASDKAVAAGGPAVQDTDPRSPQ